MSKVGFGIIGCGNIGPVHAEALSQCKKARLVAVSDVVEKSAQALAEKYGVTPYTDYRKLLENPAVEAVCLCVPSGMRADIGSVCAQAGKHILSEKPLEVNTKRIDVLINATNKAGVKLGCVFQSRFSEGAQHIHEALKAGRFGKLVMGDAYIKWFRSDEYYKSGAWRGTRKLDGGGVLMNQGVHQIDLLLWFMGPVKRVQARTALIGHEGLEVEDLACAMLEFESGALGVIEGSTATWPGHPARVEVHGLKGGAILEDGRLSFWQFQKDLKKDEKIREAMRETSALGSGAADPLKDLKCEGHRRQIEDFADAIRKNCDPTVTAASARMSVALIEAIYKSAKTGRPVTL